MDVSFLSPQGRDNDADVIVVYVLYIYIDNVILGTGRLNTIVEVTLLLDRTEIRLTDSQL